MLRVFLDEGPPELVGEEPGELAEIRGAGFLLPLADLPDRGVEDEGGMQVGVGSPQNTLEQGAPPEGVEMRVFVVCRTVNRLVEQDTEEVAKQEGPLLIECMKSQGRFLAVLMGFPSLERNDRDAVEPGRHGLEVFAELSAVVFDRFHGDRS